MKGVVIFKYWNVHLGSNVSANVHVHVTSHECSFDMKLN